MRHKDGIEDQIEEITNDETETRRMKPERKAGEVGMKKNIAVIKGDGIGPEVVDQAILVLDRVAKTYGHSFSYQEVLAGGAALDAHGVPLPKETVEVCKKSDAVLLGAMGGPKWDVLPGHLRPEKGLLGLRAALGLFANIRPAVLFSELASASPLKPEIFGDDGMDIVVVRELTGGIYFGKRETGRDDEGEFAYDTMSYTEKEIRRIAVVAFELAMIRGKLLTSVDKANVLDSSRLWRKVVLEVAKDYPEVELRHMYVDNCAMQLVINPKQFDVIVTENLFGDILSDESSMITGSIGMLPSASLGEGNFGMYEPIHGSAPDIAGMDKANPIATILSCAMMLHTTFGLDREAAVVEAAVKAVLEEGYRTGDIMTEGKTLVGTKEMGRRIAEKI
jgi:3-isopropylmalate dehydrogenase